MLERLSRAAFKPLYHLHYRWLYGRRFPGSARLSAAVARWERRWDRRDVPVSAERWDLEYRSGGWDFLHEPGERERYRAIVEMLGALPPEGVVVDVGCGDGVLLELLPAEIHPRCLGIDLSTVAVERATSRWPAARFEVANAEAWEPPSGCVVVVLNECLYYFHRPEATVARYLEALEPAHGRLVISAVDSIRTRAILSRLEQVHGFSSRRRIDAGNVSWHLAAIDPGRAAPTPE